MAHLIDLQACCSDQHLHVALQQQMTPSKTRVASTLAMPPHPIVWSPWTDLRSCSGHHFPPLLCCLMLFSCTSFLRWPLYYFQLVMCHIGMNRLWEIRGHCLRRT